MSPSPDPAVSARLGIRQAVRRTFGSLDTHNYRLYFAGDLISHITYTDPS